MSSIGQASISIDESTRIGENAQDTANQVAGNVSDINSDNKLTPSEKIKLKQEYDKDLKLYAIDFSQLQSAGLSTTELETAMNNLTAFVTPLFQDMRSTSNVDRSALDGVFTAFATADKNASQVFVNKVQQVADDAKKAGDDAKQAGEKAQELGQEAKASAEQAKTDATQAKADALTAQQKAQSSIDQLNETSKKLDGEITEAKKSAEQAQSTADNAFSKATTAIDTGKVTSQAVTDLKDGSTMTIAELENGLATKVSNSDYASYKAQTADLIAQKVDNGAFSAYQATTAKEISSKVSSDQYQSDKTQTANLIASKVSSVDFNNLTISNRNLALKTATAFTMVGDGSTNNVGYVCSLSSTIAKGTTVTVAFDVTTQNPTGTYRVQFVGGSWQPFGDTLPLVSGTQHRSYTFTTDNDYSDGVRLRLDNSTSTVTISNFIISESSKEVNWSPAPEDLATSTEFDQLSNAIKLKADSADVTSQITVATKGIQSEVNNKVTDLTTKISQTDSAWRASVNTLGTTNMVYNGGFAHGVDGWDTQNGKWGWSNQAQDQVQGSNAIQARFTGFTTDRWSNATSKAFLVRSGQKMSIGAIVTPWVLDSDPNKGFGIGLSFYASKDGTGARYNYYPEQWTYTTGRQQLKVENITVPDGANSAVVKLYIQRNGGASFTHVQANMTPTLPPFIEGFATATDITASINDINLKVSNSDGSSSQVNINNNTILLDANKLILNGNTSIQNGTIGTAKIANAAINTAQIANGAINNAKIANASIDNAKISNVSGDKIIARSITANKINVDDLIANGINTKTLTSVNLNTSTLTTPKLDLGLNGTFTEDFDYTQDASKFLPKKNKGTLTFNHGVLQSEGNMQTYVGGQWGGMNDNLVFQSGIANAQWTEVAPGYMKMDLYKQDGTSVAQRTYSDPTGFYYTSMLGDKSYLGNVLQTGQVQTPSVITKYIGLSGGQNLLQIGSNGNHYGLQVGSYAGNEAVMSDFIYDFTSSASANVRITDSGHLARTTSASKYKYNIKNPDIETTLGDRLLNMHLATWNDKRAVDSYAEQLTTGETKEKLSIKEHYGLIAEQMRDAGLDMFIDYGKNHEIEGIQYDRAWVPLLSVIRRLNDKVNEYELRLSKLEGANK